MNATATTTEISDKPIESPQFDAARMIQIWSDRSWQLLRFARRELLEKEPTAEQLAIHRMQCKWLLRIGRLWQHIVLDPEFPEPGVERMASELRGRLAQLEASWSQIQNPISEEEADKVLRQCFGDDYLK